MKFRKIMLSLMTAVMFVGLFGTAAVAEEQKSSAGNCFEVGDYQEISVQGTVAENDKAPDFTSFGGNFEGGDYLKYTGIDFETGAYQQILLSASARRGQAGKQIELHVDSPKGTKIGQISLTEVETDQQFRDCYAPISSVTGVHDLYLVFLQDTEVNLDFFTFSSYDGEKDTAEEKDARMQWWRDARYGQFIHFGAYAQLGGVYNGRTTTYAEWIMSDLGISKQDYENAAASPFNPIDFDAEEIVQLAKDAGQKYIIFTSRHHEGLSMYDTKIRGFKDYSLFSFCNHGAYTGKDPVAELSKACEKEGIEFGVYYTIMEWHDSAQTGLGYQPTISDKEEYKTRMKAQLRELIEDYHVKVLFFDGEWTNWWTKADGEELYRYLRTLDPEVIVNNRVGKRAQEDGDYGTPEQEIPSTGLDYDWESCMTLNGSWGYHKNDNNWKDANTVIDNLILCASKGGNYLLNIGPDAAGNVPEKSVEILTEAGKWIRKYGDSIYGTRASCYENLPSGVYATTKEGKVYLHMTNGVKGSQLMIPGLKNEILDISVMGSEQSLSYEVIRGNLSIDLSEIEEEDYDTVIEISLEGLPKVNESGTEENLALKADKVSGTNQYGTNFAPQKAIDHDDSTRWATKDHTSSADLVLEYQDPVTVNGVRILNYNKPNTKNWVKDYSIDYWDGNQWVCAFQDTEMGDEENLEFEAVTSQRFRLHMTNASNPSIYEFQLFYREETKIEITKPEILPAQTSRPEGLPICTSKTEFAGIYSGGSKVYVQVKGNNYSSKVYPAQASDGMFRVTLEELQLSGKYDVKVTLKDDDDSVLAVDVISVYFREQENLALGKKVTVSSCYEELEGYDGAAATDGYIGTRWSPADTDPAPWMIVDLGEETVFDQLILNELYDTWNTPNDYRCRKFSIEAFYGEAWHKIYEDTLIGEEKVIQLEHAVSASGLRLQILESRELANGSMPPANIVEFEIYKTEKATLPDKEPSEDQNPETEKVTAVFPDIPEGVWYVSYAQYVYDHGIMTGIDGRFVPEGKVTRAMVVETLYKLEGKPYEGRTDVDFQKYDSLDDVKRSDWWANSVAWALNEGIATGDTFKNTFHPTDNVTREQLAAFLYRYTIFQGGSVEESSDFRDLANADMVSVWALKEMKWAVGKGLISGLAQVGAGNVITGYDLAPQGSATRAQMAAILQRYCEVGDVRR